MKKNVGKTDRMIRWIIGIPLTAWGIYAGSWWGVLGAVLIFTAITSHCTLYSILKIDTGS